ncbi:MAG: serine--tRNA ligase [Candidatus Moranbacteria bacterium]|nr:serine--tRNA ligase [Candidatus Moranbacteria bacterium]
MLDINFIRENKEAVAEAVKNKKIDLNLDQLLEIDEKRRKIIVELDKARAERKELAKSAKGEKPTQEQIEEGKKIKQEIAKLEEELGSINDEFEKLMVKVPTVPSKDAPIGKDDSENVEIEKHGEPPEFDFQPKDHMQLGRDLDIIDFERGVKVSGYRGYYMKNEGASLQMALMMYALEKLISKGFTPMIPPTLVKEFVLFGSGYFAGRHFDENQDEVYKIATKDLEADGKTSKEEKFLIGTAEPALLAYHAGEVLDKSKLPLKICGFSPCYRSEIGSYGKDTKGLYRVHEFMKVEQVCLCEADKEQAEKLHMEMLEISKELHREIGLPYRVLEICTGDMGPGKYRMFDMEAWIPSRGDYGETGSASNFLDWQARRLNVKYKTEDDEKKFVYMLNNTAIPSPRFIISILENYQQEDGSVKVPEVLRKYMPGNAGVIKKK